MQKQETRRGSSVQVSKHSGDWNYFRLLLLKNGHQTDPKVIIRGIAMLIISLTFLCIGKQILQTNHLHCFCFYMITAYIYPNSFFMMSLLCDWPKWLFTLALSQLIQEQRQQAKFLSWQAHRLGV